MKSIKLQKKMDSSFWFAGPLLTLIVCIGASVISQAVLSRGASLQVNGLLVLSAFALCVSILAFNTTAIFRFSVVRLGADSFLAKREILVFSIPIVCQVFEPISDVYWVKRRVSPDQDNIRELYDFMVKYSQSKHLSNTDAISISNGIFRLVALTKADVQYVRSQFNQLRNAG